ncbi:glycosyltransferase family 4 protein [Xenorhabdus nematophila]|uniref:glycosyltransferase family 4 protein n=1 Tax=Xenorhabdus nematophila TaxID=628 RepID=UPI000541D961|nr:glycosyltransferase family 4 protein [Xenorhabdus nematophila]CEF32940.1 Lipopolysaccharide core biosynthesis protein RfaG (Glucosyltransferase I) [Xenorhabdus nematophila str. Websteri]AYA41544.1 glycosyltransferase family 1 protein [Xenorhabdus nematophila]KHD28672.1 glycosyl transferase family 1 [Xenorhabdus nematophila]MBA0020283.1 glycosyltransferase family 4 protein [Xenorhabdus nematophila]MCB4425473.1 glycosyltransferase [Xenorhabdus nematophila]
MKSIRLAIVRQKYRPDGGAERFISRALEALDNDSLDLNVITRSWQGDINPNWHVHLAAPFKWGRISREKRFADAAKAIWQKEHFDIVQSHERIAGCDIYRAGDGVHQRWLQQRSRILPVWKSKLLFTSRYHRYVMNAEEEMYLAPELKKVICNSQMIKREVMENFGLPDEKISVIYNAIDQSEFFPAGEDERLVLRQKYALPAQAKCFVYVGSGFERKGLKAAIEAIGMTKDYLVVIGQDKEENKYKQLAHSLGCHDRIRFLGVQKETLPFYQMADGLLLPTLYDPFPNVVLEAMACGLPVITSHTCGGSEFITSGENGFVCDALDISGLAESISSVPTDHLTSRFSMLSKEKIVNYTPAYLSQQLTELYNKVLSL